MFGDDFGNEGSSGCSVLTSSCQPGRNELQCKDYFDEKNGKVTYWVYRATRGIHDKLALMEKVLRDSVIVNGLKVDKIVEDLEASAEVPSVPDTDFAGWIGTAMMTIFSFVAGPPVVGVAGGVLGLLVAKVASLSKEEHGDVNIGDIRDAIANVFEKTADGIEEVTRLASGFRREGDEWEHLPDMQQLSEENQVGYDLPNPVSKFFATPFWLMDIDAETVSQAMENTGDIIRYKVIDTVLQSVGWVIMGDQRIEDEESCNNLQGGRWLSFDDDRGTHCFSLWWEDPEGGYMHQAAEDTKVYKGLEAHSMVKLEDYYTESIRCAKAGRAGTTSLDVDAVIGHNDQVPECFFSARVYWWHHDLPTEAYCAKLAKYDDWDKDCTEKKRDMIDLWFGDWRDRTNGPY